MVVSTWSSGWPLHLLKIGSLVPLLLVVVCGCATPAWFSSTDEAELPVPKSQTARIYPRATAPRSAPPRSTPAVQSPASAPGPSSPSAPASASPANVPTPSTIGVVQNTVPQQVRTAPGELPNQQTPAAPASPELKLNRLPPVEQTPEFTAPPQAVEPAALPLASGSTQTPSQQVAQAEVAPAGAVQVSETAVKPAVAEVAAAPTAAISPSSQSESAETKPPPYKAGDWLKRRDQAISALEGELRLAKAESSRSGESAQLETLLRLHYALAGRRDDAAKSVEGLREAEQQFWRNEAMGLVDLLGPERLPNESRRFAVALKSLEEAEAHLAAAGSLTLKNLALCKKVQDFGVIERFPQMDFTPNQEVLLYVEVRNFASAPAGENQFETELQGSFRVLDRSGTARAERTLPLDKQSSANKRRDYYIAYRLYIPPELAPGAYTLELTIEDKKGSKSNNALLDFNVTP